MKIADIDDILDTMTDVEKLSIACYEQLWEIERRYLGRGRSSRKCDKDLRLRYPASTLSKSVFEEILTDLERMFYAGFPVKSVKYVMNLNKDYVVIVTLKELPYGWDAYHALKDTEDLFQD